MGDLFYRQRRYFGLLVGLIIVIGASTFLTIGRQEDPTITNLFATIVTPYPGADPARVEALITEKIEEQLREIEEISEITSVSRTGISVVSVELSDVLADDDIEPAWSQVRDALADATVELPAGVPEPTFDNDRTSAYTIISAIVPSDGAAAVSLQRRYAELLQDRLREVPGTKYVRLFGAPIEEVRVQVDARRLTSLGLTVDDVSRAINRADAKVQAGRVRGRSDDYLIEVTGEIKTLDRIRAVALQAGADGPLVRVGDVASVSRALQEPVATRALVGGAAAVVVAARMEPDLQVDTWTANVKRAYAAYEAELPDGLVHEVLFDQSGYTRDRLVTLGRNLLIGVGLVVVLLLITLGWRAALVVASMLPLVSLASLAILQKLGIPIHQMSVTGLIVALGLLVDAAIVMTDEIKRRLADGQRREAAVRVASRRLAVPLAASTATTVFAFMPMSLLPGPAGDFVGAIAISVIVMLIVSFLLAVTITPALGGFVLPDGEAKQSWWRTGIRSGSVGRVFSWSLDLALRNRALAVAAALILPAIGVGAFPTLTSQFFPGVERDQFYIQMRLPDGASLAETETAVQSAGEVLNRTDGVADVQWFIGESAPAFYYNMIADQDGVPGFAEALVTTVSAEAAATVIPELQLELDRRVPQAQTIVRDLVQGPPVEAPVEVRLVGPELAVLRGLGDELRQLLAGIPEVTHTRATLVGGAPKLQLDLDEDKVRLAGLTLGEVARQLDTLTEGSVGGSLIEGSEELPVRVRASDGARATADVIASLEVLPLDARARAADGMYPGIPLTALGEIRLVPSDSPIERKDGERVNTVQAFLQLGVLPEEVLKQVQALLAENPPALPAGYRIEFGGDADARADTVRNLMSSIGLIVALMVATIVLTFNSFRLSLIAALVSGLSMTLSVLALAVFGYPFGIQALIGVIGSIGVSINAAIIIMTSLQTDHRAAAGDRRAIREVVMRSSRHIVSTTVTTFAGFLPLIVGGGAFWPPFAMSIAGGVLLSTVVSFYFVPPMYSLLIGSGTSGTEATQAADWRPRPVAVAAQ